MNNNVQKLKVFSKKTNGPVMVETVDSAIRDVNTNIDLDWSNWINRGWHNIITWQDQWNNVWSNMCYITTACVEHEGLPDNCDELQTMRQFRDTEIEKDDAFRQLVLEYYRNAPKIVEKINDQKDKDEILDHLYQDMIRPCVAYYKSGDTEKCRELYTRYYHNLVQLYLS